MSEISDRQKWAREMAQHLVANKSAYHHHKENMAHACIVLELAVVGWLMSVSGSELLKCFFGALWILLIWLLIHIYMRWELRNRRHASMQIMALEERLCTWPVENGPKDTEKYSKDERKVSWWQVLVDLVIPQFKYGIPLDEGGKDKCKALVVDPPDFQTEGEWIRKHRRLYLGEWLPTAASLLVFFAILGPTVLSRLWRLFVAAWSFVKWLVLLVR